LFTGLIEEVGRVRRRQQRGGLQRLEIAATTVLEDARVGDSINLNGACQTAVEVGGGGFCVESVEETLARTTLGQLRAGDPVNLERSVQAHGRLGGHLVLGHVDGVGEVRRFEAAGAQRILEIAPPADLLRYIAAKGSITIDGISLTVASVTTDSFTVSVIPHTLEGTNLAGRRAGQAVNLEVDVLARYLERLLEARFGTRGPGDQGEQRQPLTLEQLRDMGY